MRPNSCNNVFQPDPTPGAGRWAYGEGTSFSAPIVSAVAALVRQANPALTPAQVADVIRRSATQTFGTGWNEYTGAGVVNANAAVALARTYDTTPPTAVFTAVPKVGGIQAGPDRDRRRRPGQDGRRWRDVDARGRRATAPPGARRCPRAPPRSVS